MSVKRLLWTYVLTLIVALAGCQKAEPTPTVDAQAAGRAGIGPGGLPPANQLALGTLMLEGTENAVTPAQAAALLPLWTIHSSSC